MFVPPAQSLQLPVSLARRALTALVALSCAVVLMVGPAPSSATAAEVELVREVSVIGTSVEGREIRAIHRYWKGAKNRKKLVVIGSVHGNEPAGVRVASALKTATLPRNVELWIIPTANPDGLADKRRTNDRKVDLNRNFPYRWKRINAGTSTYSGRAAASEPETKALITFFKRVKPDQTVVFHQPLYGVGTAVKRMDVVRALAKETRLPVKSFSCTGVCHGSFSSWHNRALPGVAVTVEFGRSASKARIRRSTRAVLKVASRF